MPLEIGEIRGSQGHFDKLKRMRCFIYAFASTFSIIIVLLTTLVIMRTCSLGPNETE
jgi:hypothetical protein